MLQNIPYTDRAATEAPVTFQSDMININAAAWKLHDIRWWNASCYVKTGSSYEDTNRNILYIQTLFSAYPVAKDVGRYKHQTAAVNCIE